MRYTVYQEYRHSVHYRNGSAVQAGCPDCRVQKQWIHKPARKIRASAELYHRAVGCIDSRDKFEAKRGLTDSRESSACHAPKGYGHSEQAIAPLAGQYSAYLQHQPRKFGAGDHLHADTPRDRELFEQINPQDVHDLLSYLSVLDDAVPR